MNSEVISIEERAKRIKIAVFDVDGVLTNGGLMLGDDGLEYKIFHSQDGLGMKMLKNTGLRMAYITGRTSKLVLKRAENTGVDIIYQGIDDKLEALMDLVEKQGVSWMSACSWAMMLLIFRLCAARVWRLPCRMPCHW